MFANDVECEGGAARAGGGGGSGPRLAAEDAINAEIQEMFNREKEHKLLQKRIKHGLNLT